MSMRSFRHPVTNVLRALGHMESHAPEDLARDEQDDFDLEPGKWQLVDGEWVRYRAAGEAEAWAGIKAERERRKAGGVLVSGKWFHTDDSSRIQQIGLRMMGSSIPAGLQWKTMDGTFVTMTPALAGEIFAAVAASDQAIFAAAESHRAAMLASEDPAAYDFSAGWPAAFGDA